MKHNPRLNEKMARCRASPICIRCSRSRPCRARWKLMDELAHWLMELTGMPAVAMSPKAGAHGELCGMLAIKAALEARGEGASASACWCRSSAHGTNPATAAACGFHRRSKSRRRDDGRVDLET
jgi:glycine dehydrogenase subunit 2